MQTSVVTVSTALAQSAKAVFLAFFLLSSAASMCAAQSSPRRSSSDCHSKAIYIAAEYKLDKSYGYASYAAVYQDSLANNDYVLGEDAEILLFDPSMMRFAVFTTVEDNWLAINQMRDETIIPIGFYAQKKTTSEILRFNGDDAYLHEWTLVSMVDGASYPLFDDFTIEVSLPQDGTPAYYLNHHAVVFEDLKTTDVDSIDVYADSIQLSIEDSVLVYTQDTIPVVVTTPPSDPGDVPDSGDEDFVQDDYFDRDSVRVATNGISQGESVLDSEDSSENDDTTAAEDAESNEGGSSGMDVATGLPDTSSGVNISTLIDELLLSSETNLGRVVITSVNGQLMFYGESCSDTLSVRLSSGMYVVRVGDSFCTKVLL